MYNYCLTCYCYCRANLYEFADLLIRKGVVNAINLDGGGSTTFVQDDLLMNYPSDHWWVWPLHHH